MKSQNYGAGVVRGGLVHLPIPVASEKQNNTRKKLSMKIIVFRSASLEYSRSV